MFNIETIPLLFLKVRIIDFTTSRTQITTETKKMLLCSIHVIKNINSGSKDKQYFLMCASHFIYISNSYNNASKMVILCLLYKFGNKIRDVLIYLIATECLKIEFKPTHF